MSPPQVVAFDVNETLFSLERLGERFVDEGLADGALDLWFARVLRDGFAHAAAGTYASFADLGAAHLSALLASAGRGGTVEQVGTILAGMAELDAYPDVAPAFAALREAGVRIVTLTNGDPRNVQALLARAGLDGDVEACLGVDQVRAWKPLPAPYQHAAQVCGVAPAQMALVAVHSWDVHGAKRAGLVAGYCRRLEGELLRGYDEPDVRGPTLIEVVDRLLRR